jgi:hypothetical protein
VDESDARLEGNGHSVGGSRKPRVSVRRGDRSAVEVRSSASSHQFAISAVRDALLIAGKNVAMRATRR